MAWNPSPKVADCREIARKWGNQSQVIVISIDDEGRTVMATYGRTSQLCACAQILGNVAHKAIEEFIKIMENQATTTYPETGGDPGRWIVRGKGVTP